MSNDHPHGDPTGDTPEILDLSFGDGPAHRPLDARLVAGRRALLRQRLLTGVGSLAVVAVIGTTFALATGGSETAGGLDPAAAPSATPPEHEPAPVPVPADAQCSSPDWTMTWPDAPVPPDPGIEADPAPGATSGDITELPDGDGPGVGAGDPGVPPTIPEPDDLVPPELPMLPAPDGGTTVEPGQAPDHGPIVCTDAVPSSDAPGITLTDGAGMAGYAYVGLIADTESAVPVLDDGAAAGLTPAGDLVPGTGVTVLREVSEPLGLDAPDHSVGFLFTLGGERYWGLATVLVSDHGTCGRWTLDRQAVTESSQGSLEEWLAQPSSMSGFAAEPSPGCDAGSSSSSGYSSVQVAPDGSAGLGAGPNPGGVDDTTGKP